MEKRCGEYGLPVRVVAILMVLGCCINQGTALQRDALYPFGEFRNDQRMSIGDDMSTPEIQLKTPIAFYEGSYSSIFINLNGHLSFETEIPGYKSDLIIPFGFKVIAPFLADIDTRLSGNVYFRETQDPSLLETATREIQRNFPRAITFNAESLFIVTWDMVGYYREQYDQTNTFQVVLASDGFDSYVFFHYVDDGINWVQSQGKNMPVHQDPPAQAGFEAGDFSRSYTLPGSGYNEVRQLSSGSNINVHGAWLFRIGDLGGGNIELPPSTDRNEVLPEPGSSGLSCAHGCNADASCVQHQTGSCCKCDGGFFGNGINCIQAGSPHRINGRVSGQVNGVQFEPVVLHTYVVTQDGRAYTAVSRMPPLIGRSLQVVHTIGGIMGWLFALPSSPTSQNGYGITGGDFNRTATLQFVAGGDVLTITEHFEGQGVHGYMKVTTMLSGNIPTLPEKARVTVDDYKEEYKRTAPGVIKSYTTHTYRLDGVPYRFTLDQTITYRECSSAPPLADAQRMSVNRNFITFDDREQIVRFAQTNRILAIAGGESDRDPCASNPCGPNSGCSSSGETYTCVCKNGYRGDQGTSCRDIDECHANNHDCDRNAQCTNLEGSFDCRCNAGYRGNGRTCQRDLSCADLTCDINARCVFDSDIGQPRCECNSGFVGDGTQCDPVEFSCNEVNNCGENAECLYDSTEGRYKCECVDGFSGDGFSCTESEEPTRPPRPTPPPRRTTTTEREELNCRNCDAHANCVYDVDRFIFRCQCKEGYTGDGYRCQELEEVQDCSTLRNCDVNARCAYYDSIRQHRCVCEHGYRGDGYRCVAEEQDCSRDSICDYNAQCVYDATYGRYSCRCNAGYEGDGRTCRQTEISCNQVNNCDVNAECIYEEQTRNYLCRCRHGYEGDGTSCAPVVRDCLSDPNICDRNARCVRQGYSHACVCNSGYRGDGARCAPLGDTNSYLMYAQGPSIMQIPFKPTREKKGKQVLLIPGQTAVGIDVNCFSHYFYWTDVAGKAISRAKLDGTDSEVLVRGLGSPEGVAIDWVSSNMYWTDSGTDTIEVSKIDGTYRKALFTTDIHDPRAIVVDPQAGLLFWSDWNREAPKIEVSNMDGSGRRTLVSTELGLPNGLALNYKEGELCWADAGTMHIECIRYDGSGRRTVYGLASYPFGLTLHGDTFYWTDWDMKSLPSIDRFGGNPNEPITLPSGGNGKMYGIASVREQCPHGSNVCNYNNGGCRFLCLPTPNFGRTCACPDDVEEDECNTINLLK